MLVSERLERKIYQSRKEKSLFAAVWPRQAVATELRLQAEPSDDSWSSESRVASTHAVVSTVTRSGDMEHGKLRPHSYIYKIA